MDNLQERLTSKKQVKNKRTVQFELDRALNAVYEIKARH
jgi:hypothetical protein